MEGNNKYTTIDMPLSAFITALCDGDTSMIEDFSEIFMQYCESIGGEELRAQINESKDSTILRTKITLAQMMINQLSYEPLNDRQKEIQNDIFEELKKLNYHLLCAGCDLNDIKQYCKQIEGVVKLDSVTLKLKEIKQEPQKEEKQIVYTRDYFADMLIEISTAFKVSVDDNISVRQYCRWVVKYKNYCKMMNKKQEA